MIVFMMFTHLENIKILFKNQDIKRLKNKHNELYKNIRQNIRNKMKALHKSYNSKISKLHF